MYTYIYIYVHFCAGVGGGGAGRGRASARCILLLGTNIPNFEVTCSGHLTLKCTVHLRTDVHTYNSRGLLASGMKAGACYAPRIPRGEV